MGPAINDMGSSNMAYNYAITMESQLTGRALVRNENKF